MARSDDDPCMCVVGAMELPIMLCGIVVLVRKEWPKSMGSKAAWSEA